MAIAPVFFENFVNDLCNKKHDMSSDQYSIALTNTQPSAITNTVIADIAEISYVNLSTRDLVTSVSAGSGGLYDLGFNDLTLVSSGSPTGPFRYVVVYNVTAAGGALMLYYDYSLSLTLGDSESLLIDFAAVAVSVGIV